MKNKTGLCDFFITYCCLTYFQTYLLPNVFIFLENTHSNDLNELKVCFCERHYSAVCFSDKIPINQVLTLKFSFSEKAIKNLRNLPHGLDVSR